MSDPSADRVGPQPPVVPVRACTPNNVSDADPDACVDGRRMSLGDHIDELRQRLIVSLLVFGVFFLAGLFAYRQLWVAIQMPLGWTAEILQKEPQDLVTFLWLGPLEGFVAILRINLLISLVFAFPVMAHQAWGFLAPGLTHREKRAVAMIFTAGSFLFFLGVFVAFRYAAVFGMEFLIGFNQTLDGSIDRWTGDYYVSFITMLCLGFGIGFETPLVMMALAKVGLITPASIMRYWRHAMLGAVILGAVFTPPDPFTQIMLATIMAALFFVGYLLACWVQPRQTGPARDG